MEIFLILAGLVAGLVDSIAGGGGLITLPVLMLTVGAGPDAIGTNKIVGASGALMSLWVYFRHGHLDWRKGVLFSVFIAGGSLAGSSVSPLIPASAFRWLLLVTCPFILWIVWNKSLWVRTPQMDLRPSSPRLLALTGFACGFYDGVWGPGGGTFMFLGLLFVAKVPLLTAMAVSKLANSGSALVALANFARSGHVHWWTGAEVASGMVVGSYFGARHATRHAEKIVRPVLAVVVGLLLIRLMKNG